MALIWADKIAETTTTTGTGALTLAGAITGYQAFSAAMASPSDTCYYTITAVDANGVPTGDWEAGLGTYSAANTLTRTTVHASTNAGAAVNFAAGTKRVTLSITAAGFVAATAPTYTAGSVIFAGASGLFAQDNTNLFWDDTNNRLGIGTASPGYSLTIPGGGAGTFGLGITGTGGTSNITTAVSAGGFAFNMRAGSDVAVNTDFNAPDLSTATIDYRFGRGTTTTGTCSLRVYAHDGTATECHRLSSNGNAILSLGAGSTGIGVAPSGTYALEVSGSASATSLVVSDEAYDTGWNASLQVPTKNAVYDKIEAGATSWVQQDADRALTNTTAAQKIFNQSANGALTLQPGWYEFEAFIYLTGMSTTSGNAAFQLLGAGTAVVQSPSWQSFGVDSTTPLNVAARGGIASTVANQAVGGSVVTAATGTGMVATVFGMFYVNTAGTIIPSIALTTAAAATLKGGSYFKTRKIGPNSVQYVGDWS